MAVPFEAPEGAGVGGGSARGRRSPSKPRRSTRASARPDPQRLIEALTGAEISAMVRGPRDPARVSVRGDRRTLCVLDELTVVRLGLRKGQVIDGPLAAEMARGAELDRLRSAALRRLARSMCTARQMERLLLKRGASKADAAALVGHLSELGLIDDAGFAEAKARALAAAGRSGPRLIEAKLRAAGVAPETARAAAARVAALRDIDEDAVRFARRRAAAGAAARVDPSALKRRLFAALVRRGFDPAASRRALEKTLGR